ncbi:DNA mismatch repair protein MutS [Spirochaetia bacterium 38H-sp]|uniref:DNA mismatch repair protein MutS n=1 Tax=Rarispira pelagica TaxID=3141764 RepID=A0ABU9UAT6_9SPIR
MAKSTDTPMMRQYAELKKKHREEILFFRLGDFYEMFAEDAKVASRILGITLTQRNGVPMCGIPFHAASGYISKLIKAGKKVAIAEQTELPQKGNKIVNREVIEVISPGTVIDENLLEGDKNNYIVCLSPVKKGVSFSCMEVSTGDLFSTVFEENIEETLSREIARLSPSELIIPESVFESKSVRNILEINNLYINRFPDWYFDKDSSYQKLLDIFGTINLKAYGLDYDSSELVSLGPLLRYVEENLKSVLRHVKKIVPYDNKDFLVLNETTIRNLELLCNLSDSTEKFSLYSVINNTCTPLGARALRSWILFPLVNVDEIHKRQNAVAELYHSQIMLSSIRDMLKSVLDLERLSSRVALDKAHAKDLYAIAVSLRKYKEIWDILLDNPVFSFFLCDVSIVNAAEKVSSLIFSAIKENPSINFNEGNIIREGYDDRIDRLRELKENSKFFLDSYMEEEKKSTNISNLKLKYNKIIGYFFEVSKSNIKNVPDYFIPRQTLVQSARYTTDKLMELETQISEAEEKLIELEYEIFVSVLKTVQQSIAHLFAIAKSIASIDVLQSLAFSATRYGYVRPVLKNNRNLKIKGGRHPIVEAYSSSAFVPNDLNISEGQPFFHIITGPNMSGKSTYLRQNALIVLMAQIGSFVPADEAEIGVVDKIFCRIGASDNLTKGESTFLVEMNETAFILHNASEKSLIIMDEVGRGTGTTDGLAIAKAVCEYIINYVKARTLFATHFHELTALDYKEVANKSLMIKETESDIIFLKKIIDKPAERSYGIHVAKLAGVPDWVFNRALELEKILVSESNYSQSITGLEQGLLFNLSDSIIEEIKAADINNITPLKAFKMLEKWKAILNK